MQSKHHSATAAQESITVWCWEHAMSSKRNNGMDTDSMRLTPVFDAGDRQYHPNKMQWSVQGLGNIVIVMPKDSWF